MARTDRNAGRVELKKPSDDRTTVEVEKVEVEVVTESKPEPTITLTVSELEKYLEDAKASVKAEVLRVMEEEKAADKKKLDKKEHMSKVNKSFILARNNFGLWYIKRESGGVIPKVLSGKYTDESIAETAIKAYIVKQESQDVPTSFAT